MVFEKIVKLEAKMADVDTPMMQLFKKRKLFFV